MKKFLAIVVTLSMALSVPAFADTTTPVQTTGADTTVTATETTTATTSTTAADTAATTSTTAVVTTTQEAGITPDSALYSLDKLIEKIQLALISDAVKEAEALAKIAQERLAESNAMADKADIELTQVALVEYKTNLEQAVLLIETAMTDGKEVAEVMDAINAANLKDAAVVEKILTSIPEEFRAEVKVAIENVAAAAQATNETAQVVENKEEENSIKQDITNKIIEEAVKDAALIAKINEAGLNTRQVIALISLADQADKPLGEVIDLFLQNEKGIGSTAHELGLNTKDALKGINGSFKDTKETIKKAFKEAIKVVEEEDQEEVTAIVNSSLDGQTAITASTSKTTEEVKAVTQKLEKVVKEAKAQVEAITAEKQVEKVLDKAEKEIEKVEKKAEKAIEKIEKSAEKDDDSDVKVETDDKDEVESEDKGNREKSERPEKAEKSNKN
jgi:hypothetical protein